MGNNIITPPISDVYIYILGEHVIVGILHCLAVQMSGDSVNPRFTAKALNFMMNIANTSKSAYLGAPHKRNFDYPSGEGSGHLLQ